MPAKETPWAFLTRSYKGRANMLTSGKDIAGHLDKAVRYMQEGREFDSRWGYWILH
jgi:hypothetical protein